MAHAQTIIATIDTLVEHYQVIELLYEGRPARVLFSGPRRSAQSGIGLDDDPDLLFDYNQRLLEVANALYPHRVLVIGGGAFTLPMALVAALPDAIIDVVELDAGLPTISKDHFGLQTSDRLRIHIGDGRTFLGRTSNKYDLIILDVFSELSIPEQFLTVEFMQEMHETLAAQGSIALNIIASCKGRNDGLIKSQLAGYSATFATVDVYPAAYGLTGWLPQNLVLIAQKDGSKDFGKYVRYAAIEPVTFALDDARHDEVQ